MGEDDENYDLSEDEFATWLSPPEVLRRLDQTYNRSTSLPLILKRIGDEELFSAARKIVVTEGRSEHATKFRRRIPKSHWAGREHKILGLSQFWEAGDVVFDYSNPGNRPPLKISCVDVRFDPDGVDRLIPVPARPRAGQTAEAVADAEARHKPARKKAEPKPAKVTRDELRPWIEEFEGENRRASFKVILQAARAAFHPRHVAEIPTKMAIADLGLTLSVGKQINL